MPTITKSIGTTSRDYSTISSWEADLDNDTPYDAGDDAVGECYDDSEFDESVTIDGGGTLGLNSVTLTVADGEEHDGTAGTGARVVRTADGEVFATTSGGASNAIRLLEVDVNGNDASNCVRLNSTTIDVARQMLCHGTVRPSGTGGEIIGIHADGGTISVLNCVVYDLEHQRTSGSSTQCSGFLGGGGSSIEWEFLNCTAFNINDAGGAVASGFWMIEDESQHAVQNCVACEGTNFSAFDMAGTSNITVSHNASSDATAPGSNSLTNITTADQFVSTVNGSEDLHLKSGADCIDAGTDLGTTPTGVNIDIDGRDRDAEGDTWDIGADEFVSESGTSVSASAALTTAAAEMDASATHEAPTFSGSANITAPAAEMNASAAFTVPIFEATAALTTSAAVMDASGTFTPTFTGSAAITAAAATMTASASHDTNLSTGSAELTTAPVSMDASGTFTAPVFSATASITVPAAEMDASAQFTPPTSSGSANIIGPAAEMDASATFAEGTFTATASLSTAPAEMTASATHVTPSFTASAALTTVAATMDATATFTTDVFTASASLVTSPAVMAATGTFVVVQRSAIITNEVIRKPQVINERIRKTAVANESIE